MFAILLALPVRYGVYRETGWKSPIFNVLHVFFNILVTPSKHSIFKVYSYVISLYYFENPCSVSVAQFFAILLALPGRYGGRRDNRWLLTCACPLDPASMIWYTRVRSPNSSDL